MKKVVKIFGIVLLLLFAFAMLFPILYKKEIIQQVKSISSEQINGKLEFTDLDISLIRHFPKLNIKLINLYIDSYVNNDTSRLFEAKDFLNKLKIHFCKALNLKTKSAKKARSKMQKMPINKN